MRKRYWLVGATLLVWIGSAACGNSRGATNDVSNSAGEAEAEQVTTRTTALDRPSLEVRVKTDKTGYRPGEHIYVTIENGLPLAIGTPATENQCAAVMVQRLEAGQWVGHGSCPGHGSPIFVPSGTSLTIVLGAEGPIVGGPFPAGTLDMDLRTLPTVVPNSLPAREVPLGILPPGQSDIGNDLSFSVVEGELEAGTYRLVLLFERQGPEAALETVYSADFIVG